MDFKNRIKKAAVLSLAVGSLAVAGLGFAGTASADDGVYYTQPQQWAGQPTVAWYQNWYNANQYYSQQVASQQAYLNYYYYYGYYNNFYVNNYVNNVAVQSQRTLIAASAEVLNLPVQTVVSQLSTGRSLTTIAAQRGWARQNFVNAVVSRVQVRVAYGATTPAIGNALVSRLVSQSFAVVDVAGTQTLLGLPAATFY